MILYRNNSNTIKAVYLHYEDTNAPITTATVNGTLYESDGTTAVTGGTVTMSHDTNGVYKGILNTTPLAVLKTSYRLKIVATIATNVATWMIDVEMRDRKG